MRGKQGEELTNLGDYLYDWAKIYQSILGYDEILLHTKIDVLYKQKMISFFENEFTSRFSHEALHDLKLITKSLLFTIIPLHSDHENQRNFYNLISSV